MLGLAAGDLARGAAVGDHQALATAQIVAAQIVGQLELLHAHPVILGDAGEGIAAGDLIGAHTTGTFTLRQIGQGQLQGVGVLDGYQQVVGASRRGHATLECRIEGLELGSGDTGQLRRHVQVDLATCVDGPQLRLVGQHRQGDIVLVRIADHVGHGQDLGHIHPGFTGQVQRPVIGRPTGLLIADDGIAYPTFTGIVSGQRLQPVAVEETVQVLQIVQCGIGGGQYIAAAVIPVVVAQAEVLAGSRNELPKTDRIAAGAGIGIEHALDHGDGNKLHWQLTPFDFLYHQIQVGLSPAGNGRHMLIITK